MKNLYRIYLIVCVGALATAMDNPDKYKYETPFTRAIITGDLPTVESLLQQDCTLANQPNLEGVPPLFLTTECECNKELKKKLALPIDAETKKKECLCVVIADKLLLAGADKNYYLKGPIDDPEAYGTPLMVALKEKRGKIFKKILAYNPDLTIAKPDGTTVFLMAAKAGYTAVFKRLVAAGVDVKQKDKQGKNALYYLVATEEYRDTVDNIERLIKGGQDINQEYAAGNNALMLALKHGMDKYLVENLLKFGINIKHRNVEGKSALDIARNTENIMKQYIIPILEEAEKEAEKKVAEKSLSQCLRHALDIGLVGSVAIAQREKDSRELVQVDTDLEKLSKKESPELDDQLIMAAVLGKHDKVADLLKKGANPTVQTEIRKETPLMLAARKGYLPCVKALLTVKSAEQINITNAWGFRALDMAAEEGAYDLIPELVNAGVDVNRCPSPMPDDKLNKKGQYPYLTPLLRARYENKHIAAKALIECGAKEVIS